MQDSELEKLIKKQLQVCKEATEFVITSSDLLKRAVTRIYELETLIHDLSAARYTNEKIKKKKQKKKKDK